MNILTDNIITRLVGSTLDKLKLGALLLDDIFKYFFTADSFGPLRKYLYLMGIGYMGLRTARSLGMWWSSWGWMLKEKDQFNGDQFKMRYGEGCWVVVTGFASGIGLAFAQEFARMGYNLLLVDCQKERAEFSERWVKQYNKQIKTKVVILDLTADSHTIQSILDKQTEDIDIGVLVNNAGMSAGGPYIDIKINDLIACYKLNVLSVIHLTTLLVPRMTSRTQRSAIINLSSGISHLSSPQTGIYPATKQFVRIFSRSLDLEINRKIDILCLKPLGVTTNMMKFRKNDWTMVTPQAVAHQAIHEVGFKKETFGAMPHKILATILASMSEEERFHEFVGRYKTK